MLVSIGHYWSKIIKLKDSNKDDKYPLLATGVSAKQWKKNLRKQMF